MGNTSTHRIKDADTDYGVVGVKTLRTAAQIGNTTGPADFGVGPTTAQTLRVVLANDANFSVCAAACGINIFDEKPAIPKNVETSVVAYIPSVAHFLKRASASGVADATFNLKIDGVIIARKRNNWTERNVEFDLGENGIPVLAGKTIEISVISSSDAATCPFDGNLYGEEP